jgi:hypothetical protein
MICAMLLSVSCKTTWQAETDGPGRQEDRKPAAAPFEIEDWRPLPPAPDESDWIRMSSGEWLRGEIEILQDEILEFDSEDLGNLEIDWEDVVEVRSPRIHSFRFDGNVTAVGTLVVRDDYVIVGGEEEQFFDRASLLTILPGKPTEFNYWSGTVGVGLASRSGNTDQREYTGYFNLLRRKLGSRYTADYIGNYGELDGDRNLNNHRLNTKFDAFLTRRFFLTPLGLEGYRDPFQNIDHQLTPFTGLGYIILDEHGFDWEIEGLVGYRYTVFDSVEVGEDRTDTDTTFIGITKYEMDITKDLEFMLDYSIRIPYGDLGAANQHAVTSVSVDVGHLVDLNVMFTWDRVGDPEPDANGVVPEKNDYRLVVGLELEF